MSDSQLILGVEQSALGVEDLEKIGEAGFESLLREISCA